MVYNGWWLETAGEGKLYQLAMKELCVRCGKETKYDTGTPITLRRYFIEGAGQLCEECWAKLWPREEEINIKKAVRENESYKNAGRNCGYQ